MKKIKNTYKKSGVNISLTNKFVKHITSLSKKGVKKGKTLTKEILVVLDLYMILANLKLRIQL